ncbi:isochorismate synthase [Halogranum amylolyticum]|uniref:isochorismate synthase n=1 Tax=Halogranum amylolyticum TaxID=660520 RepID=A0A1H8SKQ6_9EURY|nr:isochorismate synthase [Halogranum amylolyticum]SEO79147.1 isochorismate synthase [Halogranum amylolyticum]
MGAPQRDPATVGEGLVSRAVQIQTPPFRAVLGDAAAPRTVWSAPDEATVVGSETAATLTAEGPDRFHRIRDRAERLFETGNVHAGTEAACPRLFGGFAFHDDGAERPPWTDFPGARFVLPRVQVTYADNGTWLTVNAVGPDATPEAVEARLEQERERLANLPDPGPVADPPGVVDRTRTTELDDWRASVEAAVDRIRSGELQKVVLAQALECSLSADLSVPDILDRLAEKYPDCHRFLVEPASGAASFFGATPERLVTRRGRTVETGALAGTTGRGETPAEDEWLAEELMESEKNVHEHELVADAIRDQLAPFAASMSTGERTVRRLATVQHLWTPITAELASDYHVLDLVEALHPTPAVGGLPPEKALDTIRDTEPFDRGWYAAPVGWIDAAGNGSFAVALRSAVATEDVATLFAGVGVVADSDPDREWDEVQLKYRPILDELER